MINQIKSVKETVKMFLQRHPQLRDSDTELIANIWITEMGGQTSVSGMNAMQAMGYIATGKVSSPESIMRCRRKLQEEFPELRGKNYLERQESAKIVQKEIKYV